MKRINQRTVIIGLVLFLFVSLPILLYVSLNRQFIGKKAAFGEITLNIVPTTINKNLGEPVSVEVYAAAGTIQVSAISLSLSTSSPVTLNGQSISIDSSVFTDIIYDPSIDPLTVTLLSRKPTSQLPKGDFKVASLVMIPQNPGTGTMSVNTAKSKAVGYNGTSQDVELGIRAGTSLAYTVTGSLCKIAQCVASPALTASLRPDNTHNVNVSWQAATASGTLFYKIYRNTGAAVDASHPDNQLIGTSTGSTSITDTNNGQGFSAGTQVHYDIDTYTACQ